MSHRPPRPPGTPVAPALAGPRALTMIGAALVVVGIGLYALAIWAIDWQTRLVDTGGNPGSASLAAVDTPGAAVAHLQKGYYTVYLAASNAPFAQPNEPITVRGTPTVRPSSSSRRRRPPRPSCSRCT